MLQEIHFVHWFCSTVCIFWLYAYFFPPNRMVNSHQPRLHPVSSLSKGKKTVLSVTPITKQGIQSQSQSNYYGQWIQLPTVSPSGHVIEKGCCCTLRLAITGTE